MLRAMGRMMTEMGVKPEIEAFDTGHLWFAKQLVDEGILEPDALVQLCMGVPWGAPDDLGTFLAMVNAVPPTWTFSAFALGRSQMPFVAASVLAGGNVRVGLEDNRQGRPGNERATRRTRRDDRREPRGARDRSRRSASQARARQEGTGGGLSDALSMNSTPSPSISMGSET
jgi:hypothetical protein